MERDWESRFSPAPSPGGSRPLSSAANQQHRSGRQLSLFFPLRSGRGEIGRGPDVGRMGCAPPPCMEVTASRDSCKATAKLQGCIAGGKQLPAVLELRPPREPRAGERVLLSAVPRAATTGLHSRLLQPHGLVRGPVSGDAPGRGRRPGPTGERGGPVRLGQERAGRVR